VLQLQHMPFISEETFSNISDDFSPNGIFPSAAVALMTYVKTRCLERSASIQYNSKSFY